MRTVNESSNLDVLRAIGVVVVFCFHLALALGGPPGYTFTLFGVDPDPFGRPAVFLFFAHTSFVLMQSLERLATAGDRLVSTFFIRRVFRIYPLSIVIVLAILALHIPRSFHSGPFVFPGWSTVVSNLLLCQNLTTSASISLPMWTLPFEVQMYALLPFVYLSLRRSRSVRGAMLWYIGATLAAPAAALVSYRAAHVLQFFPCFIAGVVAYKLSGQRPARRWPSWCWPIFIVLLMALYGIAVTLQHVSIWSFGLRDFLSAGLTTLILGLMLPRFKYATNPVWVYVTTWIAKHSYGIYLTHMSVMWISFVALASRAAPLRWLVFVTLSLALPAACQRWIENPMIQLGRKLTHRERASQTCKVASAGAGL